MTNKELQDQLSIYPDDHPVHLLVSIHGRKLGLNVTMQIESISLGVDFELKNNILYLGGKQND